VKEGGLTCPHCEARSRDVEHLLLKCPKTALESEMLRDETRLKRSPEVPFKRGVEVWEVLRAPRAVLQFLLDTGAFSYFLEPVRASDYLLPIPDLTQEQMDDMVRKVKLAGGTAAQLDTLAVMRIDVPGRRSGA